MALGLAQRHLSLRTGAVLQHSAAQPWRKYYLHPPTSRQWKAARDFIKIKVQCHSPSKSAPSAVKSSSSGPASPVLRTAAPHAVKPSRTTPHPPAPRKTRPTAKETPPAGKRYANCSIARAVDRFYCVVPDRKICCDWPAITRYSANWRVLCSCSSNSRLARLLASASTTSINFIS